MNVGYISNKVKFLSLNQFDKQNRYVLLKEVFFNRTKICTRGQ